MLAFLDKYVPEDLFGVFKKYLEILGVWNLENNISHLVYRIVVRIAVLIHFINGIYFTCTVVGDVGAFFTAFGLTMTQWGGVGGYITSQYFETDYKQLVKILERKEFAFEGYENGEILQKINAIKDRNIFSAKKYSIINAALLTGTSFIDIIVGQFILTIIGYFNGANKLPYETYVPFEINSTFRYFTLCILQMVMFFYTMIPIIFHENFGMSCCIVIVKQLNTIRAYLKILSEQNIQSKSDEIKHKIKFVKAIKEINALILAVDIYEKCRNLDLLRIMFSMTCMSCGYVTILMESDTSTAFRVLTLVTLFLCIFYPFVISLFAQLITNEFIKLSNDIYMLNWTEFGIGYRRDIRFSIARFQKPIQITCGKFVPMQLPLFVEYLRACYSFYTLSTQSNNRNN